MIVDVSITILGREKPTKSKMEDLKWEEKMKLYTP